MAWIRPSAPLRLTNCRHLILAQASTVRRFVLFGLKPFEDVDREERIRACYQHCCLRYVMNEKMTNQSLRERFKLPEEKAATTSQIITATLDAEKIKLADPAQTSTRYRSYLPYWA